VLDDEYYLVYHGKGSSSYLTKQNKLITHKVTDNELIINEEFDEQSKNKFKTTKDYHNNQNKLTKEEFSTFKHTFKFSDGHYYWYSTTLLKK